MVQQNSRGGVHLSNRMSQSGHTVPLHNKRPLASLRNPLEEAERWVSRALQKDLVGKRVIILGGGGYYHIEAILNRIAFESLEIIEFFSDSSQLPEPSPDYTIHTWSEDRSELPESIHKLLQQGIIFDACLVFRPACGCRQADAIKALHELTGRTPATAIDALKSLGLQLTWREPKTSPLSIKDINDHASSNSSSVIWEQISLLREFIK